MQKATILHLHTRTRTHSQYKHTKITVRAFMQFTSIAVHTKLLQWDVERHHPAESYVKRPSHGRANFPIKLTPPPPKSYLCYRVAETNGFALTSCRGTPWWLFNLLLLPIWKVYDPLCDNKKKRNVRDGRSVRPVCHRAARLESPFRKAQKEGRSRHGTVWKAPAGDGGNLQMKWWREGKRERE